MAEIMADQSNLSLRDKSLLKRNMSRHHNNSLRAGYVPVNEQYLHKTGLRGRKTYAFWTLIVLLFCMALGNLLLTFTILGVLRLGQGLESMELMSEESLIKFYGNTDLDRVYKRDGKLEGFGDAPVEITGENGSVMVKLIDSGNKNNPKITSSKNGTSVTGVKSFEVQDPSTGQSVFSTDFPNFGLPQGVQKLDIKLARTHRITSPVNSTLTLSAESYVRMRGNEGTHMDGREMLWTADQDIFLKSVKGSVVLNAKEGISLDVRNMPIAYSESTKPGKLIATQYKVCVCMPNGKLFRVPVLRGLNQGRMGCHNYPPDVNPCI